jgi:hypothetical protein
LLLPLQIHAGRDTDEAIMMWNPPWTLPFVMPFGVMPARVAQLAWLVLHLFVVLFCADWAWRWSQGPVRLRWVAWLLALTFIPTAFVLQAGQITPLVLLGLVGFLHFHQRNGWLAGACTLLIAIKPHLLFLFWVALLLWAVPRRQWSMLLGGLAAGGVATLVAWLCNSAVLAQYQEAMLHRPPEQWVSPTPGSMLRLMFGQNPFWLQFLPTLAGLAWFLPYWWTRRDRWDWAEQMPLLVMASFLTACYGAWPFDLVILLLPVIQAAAWTAKQAHRVTTITAVASFLGINGLALAMNVLHFPSFWFIWMTPAVLAAFLLLRPWRNAPPRPTQQLAVEGGLT